MITKASVGEEPGAGPRRSGEAKSARRDSVAGRSGNRSFYADCETLKLF